MGYFTRMSPLRHPRQDGRSLFVILTKVGIQRKMACHLIDVTRILLDPDFRQDDKQSAVTLPRMTRLETRANLLLIIYLKIYIFVNFCC